MSMSEFDQEPSLSGFDKNVFSSEQTERLPEDFSEEEYELAHELNSLFSISQEEMPPLFVQTLLAAEDLRFEPVDDNFERRTQAQVFERLRLHRQLFSRNSQSSLQRWMKPLIVSRSLITIIAACLLFMIITMALAGPTFASGWTYLWSGKHSGVIQVTTYPAITAPSTAMQQGSDIHQLSLDETISRLHFPMFWPYDIPTRYSQSDIYLYPGDPDWSDGPIVLLSFAYNAPDGTVKQIAICEFKPQGKVLQVVQDGSAHQIKINRDDSPAALYIEGQWQVNDQENGQLSRDGSHTWVHTDRSELIYEVSDPGVVFWIVGDRSDGIDEGTLGTIAKSLHIVDLNDNLHTGKHFEHPAKSANGIPWPFAGSVIYTENSNSSDGPTFHVINHDQRTDSSVNQRIAHDFR